jgi:hypothetical protein
MVSNLLRQVAVAVALVFMLWSNLGGGGRDDENRAPEMYTAYPTAFSPAPYTFAVWAPIFLGCIALTVYQGLSVMRHDSRFQTLGWLVAVAFLLTAATAYTPIGISNAVITALTIALALAYVTAARAEPQTTGFAWCVRIPIALFLGWCAVATILNGCQFAVSRGFPVGPVSAAVLIAIAATAGVGAVLRWHELTFGLVLVWAFWGIVAAQPGASPILVATAVGSIALLGAMAVAWRGAPGAPVAGP